MERPSPPWLVRIEGKQPSEVFGAGTLLDEMHVLTCAHVVNDPGSEVYVRIQGRSEQAYAATVVPDCWIPPDPNWQRGDIAVLRLAEPAKGAPRARLRRSWKTGETVHCFGFRAGAQDQGVTAEGRIQNYDLGGERVQLNVVSAPRISRGFSGSAARTSTGEIYGVIVSVDLDEGDTSWMIDVQALLEHTGQMLRPYLVVGAPPDDLQFTDPRSQRPGPPWTGGHTALRQALADWLGSDDEGGVAVICGAAAAAVVTRLVGPTVPAYRERIDELERETVLPLGSVDAAVDATGRTAAEVTSAIARRLDLRVDEGGSLLQGLAALGPPVTIVVNCVDQAAEPEKLCEEVLLPIAVRAPLLRVRLLLGFTVEPWDDLRDAVVAGADAEPPEMPPCGLDRPVTLEELEELEELVQLVATAEQQELQRYAHVSPRILHVPRLRPPVAVALRVRLSLLRAGTNAGAPAEWYVGRATEALRLGVAAKARAEEVYVQLEKSMAERQRLRNLLDVYRSYAQDLAYERENEALEDEGLSELYNKAYLVLHRGLADLNRARRRVDRYVEAVRSRFPDEDS